jgi:N,N'-diacetylbacillosaminyl-diphospho-undecaprenol alpha-1,3-N-acetylgalactosaminyltransferase
MKILMICNTDGALYVFRKPIIKAALAAGHDVVGISGKSEYVERLQALGVHMHVVDFSRHSVGLLNNFRLFLRLLHLIRIERPDVVHGFTHKPAIYGTLAAWLAGVKRVHVTITGLGTLFVHNDIKTKILRRFLLWQYRAALHCSDLTYFQNSDDLEEFTRLRIVKVERAVLTNGSGIDLSEYPFPSNDECRVARHSIESEFGEDLEGKRIILFPARGVREKGFFEFYEAARIIKGLEPQRYLFLHLGLVDGASSGGIPSGDIAEFARQCGVRYLGFKDDIDRYLRGSDIVVLPSYREGTPRSLIEALALGKCIITTDVPGCRETVLAGWNGYLCTASSSRSLAATLLRVEDAFIVKARTRARKLCEIKYDARWLTDLTLSKYVERDN